MKNNIVLKRFGAVALALAVILTGVFAARTSYGFAAGEAAAIPIDAKIDHPGVSEKKNTKAVIDFSNVADGYVMCDFTADTTKVLKVIVKGPKTSYTYNLTPKKWAAFPLSDGNGKYTVGVYENTSGTKYSTVVSTSFTANMKDEFAPFIRSNQYVDYSEAVNTVAKGKELVANCTTALEKVNAVYNYIVPNFTYDKEKAATVKSGYLPVLDTVLAEQKGICFDYAAVMTAMLRSNDVPCKLVVGYAGTQYHAWISVYSPTEGWIENVVYFDGKTWQRMDPTFASSAKQSAEVLKYIGDGKNYSEKYFY